MAMEEETNEAPQVQALKDEAEIQVGVKWHLSPLC